MSFLQCAKCGETQLPLKRCDRCRIVRYCSEECKNKDADVHKAQCENASKKLSSPSVASTPLSAAASPASTNATSSKESVGSAAAADVKGELSSKEMPPQPAVHLKGTCTCCHIRSPMPALSESQIKAHKTAMTKFIGQNWPNLFHLYLENNPLLALDYLDGIVLIDCKKTRFVDPSEGSKILKAHTSRPGAGSGIFLLDWAEKTFKFIPNDASTKIVMKCMTEHLPRSFHDEPNLWIQVWMDAKDPLCAEPWWNFGWTVAVFPLCSSDGTITPNLSFTPI